MNRKKLHLKFMGDKHYQWNTLVVFLSSLLFTGVLVMLTMIIVLLKSARMEDIIVVFGENIINKIVLYSMASLTVCILITIFVVMDYSNKIAGPLYRLKLYLHDMINGNSQKPLKFREDDEFKELTFAVNSFRNKLRSMKAMSKK